MKYLKSVNESIEVDKINQTLKWIKEKIGYDEAVGIFNEIKVTIDDVGDFKWFSKGPNVCITYTYLSGNQRPRRMKNEFYLSPENDFTKIITDQSKTKIKDHINKFLGRIDLLTKISTETQMGFSFTKTSANLLKEAFTNPDLETIQSAEGIKIQISYVYRNYSLSEFIDFLSSRNITDHHNVIRISFTKDLPNNIFSDGDSTPPEKIPESIIKDFTEFTNRVKLSNADKKELIRIINRGITTSMLVPPEEDSRSKDNILI